MSDPTKCPTCHGPREWLCPGAAVCRVCNARKAADASTPTLPPGSRLTLLNASTFPHTWQCQCGQTVQLHLSTVVTGLRKSCGKCKPITCMLCHVRSLDVVQHGSVKLCPSCARRFIS